MRIYLRPAPPQTTHTAFTQPARTTSPFTPASSQANSPVRGGSVTGEHDCNLGPDSTKTGTGTSTDPYIVTNNAAITFAPTSLEVTQGTAKTQIVSVALGVSGDTTLSSFDKLEVTPASVDGITVTPSSKDGTITFAVSADCKIGTYTFSVFCSGQDTNGTHLQTKTFTVTVKEPEPTPVPAAPVVSGDLPEDVVPATATAGKDVETVAHIISSDFTSSDLTTDAAGNVIVKPDVAAAAIGDTLGKEVASGDILCFPVVGTSEDVNKVGKTIMFTFAVSGDQLTNTASAPSKLCVYKLLNSEKAEAFTYAASPSEAADKMFTVQNQDGTDATTIAKGETYLVSAYVEDNGTFDLDHNANGGIIDPIAIDTSATTPSTGSASNGGCNAGFGALALAALAAACAAKQRKK